MRTRNAVLSLSLALAAPAIAQPHEGDILLSIENGRIATGLIEEGGGTPVADIRVFAATLGTLGPDTTDEPGFDGEPGTFPPGSANGFRIHKALRVWDGAAFATIPDGQIAITLSAFPPLGPVFSPTTDQVVTGFTIPVLGAGDWHHHLEYTLTAPAAPGVYLLELSIFSTDTSIAESMPFWLVINKGRDAAEHDAALDWTKYVLARIGCRPDWDRNRVLEPADVAAFVAAWFTDLSAGTLAADFDGNGATEPSDVAAMVGQWFTAINNDC